MTQSADPFLETWQTLFGVLSNTCQEQNERDMQAIFSMIRNRLVFESPGIFPGKILSPNDSERCQVCNFWLIHKLINLLLQERLSGIHGEVLALLKDILAGCIVMQRWLFNCILEKFLGLAKDLLALHPPNELLIDHFTMAQYDLSIIDRKMSFSSPKVTSEATARRLLDSVVQILTTVEHSRATSRIIMEVLNKGNLSSKIYALEYFNRDFQYTLPPLSSTEKAQILNVLMAIENMSKKLPFWLSMERFAALHMENLEQTLTDLFQSLKGLVKLSNKSDCKIFFSAQLRIICTFHRLHEEAFGKLKSYGQIFISYGEELISHVSLDLEKQKVEEIIKIIPKNCEAIKLLEFTVTKEVQSDLEGDTVLSRSKTWQEICSLLSNQSPEKEHHQEYLLLFSEVLRMGVKITLMTSTKCFGSNFNDIIDLFMRSIDVSSKFASQDTRLFILIAQDLISLPDFQECEEKRQRFILEVILSPLTKVLKRQMRDLPEMFANAKQSMSSKEVRLDFVSLRTLFSVREENIPRNLLVEVKKILRDVLQQHQRLSFDSQVCLFPFINSAIARNLLQTREVQENFMEKVLTDEKFHVYISQSLKQLICILSGRISSKGFDRGSSKFNCTACEEFCQSSQGNPSEMSEEFLDQFLKLFSAKNEEVLFNMIECIKPLLVHFPRKLLNINLWLPLMQHERQNIRKQFAFMLPQLLDNIYNFTEDEARMEALIRECQESLLNVIVATVTKKTKFKNHYSTLLLLEKFSECRHLPEHIFMQCFKMIFLFVINPESLVAGDATIMGREMCLRRKITARDMLNWYKEDVLKIIMTLCVGLYRKNDVGLYPALTQVAKMMGYTAAREFIAQHFKLIIAMLIPYCINEKKCEKLLQDVCQHAGQGLNEVLSAAFVTIYTYLFLSQTAEVNNKCIDYVIQNTSHTLYHHLHSDIKRTIPEVLVYYHKNPNFVMHAFRSLLSKNEVTLSGVADYISTRFLGVLTTFESLILASDTEKALKRETLLSLGEIVRFMGPEHITQYRFKILTLLKTAVTINDDGLKRITAGVWTIFLRTIDVQRLGPLLSTIIVSLEPLLPHEPQQVSDIFSYLIIENRSLLSSHFGDLFFIEETHLGDPVKAIVSSQRRSVRQSFAEQFDLFRKHINHENLEVRTYGFKYLARLFAECREALNRMVIDQLGIDSMLMGCIDTMMQGCRHIDENLQEASGVCLGELGALEPSHLPPNYAPQKSFALNIHTDEFATMALAELCRAYQFQKNSHYVDSFSLAIQEILQARGVDPRQHKKVAVWQAIPERMRQLMEPLLTSCYTGLSSNVHSNIHPVFGSSKCHSVEHWTFIWASNMILGIQEELTSHLLKSFRPSIKYDMQTMAMFLPYIILHALLASKEEHRTKIAEEFHQVFTAAANVKKSGESKGIERHFRGVRSVSFIPTDDSVERESKEEMVIKCAKMAFNQLDFLEVWLQHCLSVQENPKSSAQTTLIRKFIDQFECKLLAKANFNSGEYARSLQFLEQYISKNPNKLQEELPFLAEIYAELMDPDNVEGAIGMMTEKLPLPEQIAMNTVTGRVAESSVCFEKLIQRGEITPSLMNSLVQYYVALDQPETALLVSESLLNQFQDFNVDKLTLELRAEPLWQMGRFEDLDELITGSQLQESDGWGVRCGALLLSYRDEQRDTFAEEMRKARLSILKSLRCAEIEQNTYQKGYSDVLKLHMVTEIEKAFNMMGKITESMSEEQAKVTMREFFSDWDARIKLLQPSTRIVEPVLRLRRILLQQGKRIFLEHCGRNPLMKNLVGETLNTEMGKLWLKSAELARKEGLYQQAQLYLLNLEEYRVKESFLERAKLLWSRGDQSNTFQVLDRGLSNLLKGARVMRFSDLPRQERLLYAEGKFLIASYNAEAMNIETELNINYFREAIEALPECEKSLVYYAQFLDKIFNSLPEDQQTGMKGTDLQKEIMMSYGKSLQFGCNYLFQSMPRLLSIWLDYTAQPIGCDKRVSKQMTEQALHFSNTLPSYMFFTAFSQLVSRICHPSTDVYQILRTILIKLILDYPQQSLWMILSVLKSSYASRSRRCIEVLSDQRLKEPTVQRLINDFNRLAEKLIELTNKNIPNHVKDPKVSSLVPQLPLLFKDAKFSRIVIPAQKFMQPELPSAGERDSATAEHNAFPRRMFYIQNVKNTMVILRSLQRPRKIILLADDGLEYSVLMKPKDDLRKDFRLMEFNAVVKQYLRQDPEARQRRLGIRTYSVLPLNEECGIIEWVSNLTTLRSILMTLYKRNGHATDMSDMKKIETARDRVGKSGKIDIFVNIMCKRHPPIFGEWFKTTFTTPFNWYQARTSYIRTTAVMSIVGYILGLGDRHGENILYDHTNGDTVHVDFNCLFNKGESLGVPEVVPFRLTHNMVHAMGPLGVEGLYRKCCEVTLRVLQMQTSTLMSVLRPFVYDPLVSWHKKDKERTDNTRERTDPQALTNLNHIEERLKGFVKINGRRAKMPLSTEGQVNFVIKEATDLANLAAMYIGWGAYM